NQTRLWSLVGLRAIAWIPPPQLFAFSQRHGGRKPALTRTRSLITRKPLAAVRVVAADNDGYCLGRCHCRCADGREGAATWTHTTVSIYSVGCSQRCPAADRSSWRLRRRDQAPVPCLRDMRSLVAACLRRHVALRARRS